MMREPDIYYTGKYNIDCGCGFLTILTGENKSGIWLNTDADSYFICGFGREGDLKLPFYPDEAKPLLREITENYPILNRLAMSYPKEKEPMFKFFIAGGRDAIAIAEENPAFALLLALNLRQTRTLHEYNSELQRTIRLKRTEILDAAGYPSGRWVLKALRKIPIEECSRETLVLLHSIILTAGKQQVNTMRHLNVLNKIYLRILNSRELSRRVDPGFFIKTTNIINDKEYYDQLDDEIAQLAELLEINRDNEVKFQRIYNAYDVFPVHDRLIKHFNDLKFHEDCKRFVFDKPPIAGLEYTNETGEIYGIVPITNGSALWEEGQRMLHCIGNYAERIQRESGRLYAYHIRIPDDEHATIMIAMVNGERRIKEIRGKKNATVSKRMLHFAYEWLDGNGKEALDRIIDGN